MPCVSIILQKFVVSALDNINKLSKEQVLSDMNMVKNYTLLNKRWCFYMVVEEKIILWACVCYRVPLKNLSLKSEQVKFMRKLFTPTSPEDAEPKEVAEVNPKPSTPQKITYEQLQPRGGKLCSSQQQISSYSPQILINIVIYTCI